MALNADGFHSISVATGPRIEDSEIAFTGDDHVNILARMLVVCEPLEGEEGEEEGGGLASPCWTCQRAPSQTRSQEMRSNFIGCCLEHIRPAATR